MLTLADVLALLARWADLDDTERTALNDALTDTARWEADELPQLAEALHAAADSILDLPQDDVTLEALGWIADVVDGIRAETTARETAETERAEAAQALADRIRGPQADTDPDGEPAAGEAPAEPEAEAEVPAEPVAEDAPAPEPVAAAAAPRVTRVAARRPAAVAPRPASTRQTAALTASANVPNVSMGARLDSSEALAAAFSSTLSAMGSMSLRPGMRVPVATAVREYPEDSVLGMDARANARRIAAATSVEAITAAGGTCASPTPRYDLPLIANADRPVTSALVQFGADRHGVTIPSIPTLADVEGAITVWTEAMDVAAVDDAQVRKSCLRVECGTDEPTSLDAIVQCLEFGNFDARSWPEKVEAYVALASAQHARTAETKVLTRMGALSTQVTVPQSLGTARDVLAALDLATAAHRNRHRTNPNLAYRWVAPAWLRAQIRADLTREMPGSADERLAAADATIDSFFAARQIMPVWSLDGETGQVFGAQSDGQLLGWIPTAVTYLYVEGSFLFLDGDELNFGVVRDSTLNASNDFQMAVETFEQVALHGVEPLRLTFTLCPTGASAGTLDPVCEDVAAS